MSVVRVKQGLLEGNIFNNEFNDSTYYSFKGIPYAKPPVGKLRFKAPEPPDEWQGIRAAKEHAPMCPQNDIFSNVLIEGNEDCLYLNVYTNNLVGRAPVMFWIHGGGFKCGNGDSYLYGPEFLLSNDVVVVTITYRIEAFGFLCLDTESVPGNAGMKDQVAALKWVQDNIDKFGGDPDNVTIFGESAGGASVSFQMLSPMSKGLFHKAIVQSGAATCEWACGYESRRRGFEIGKRLGFQTDDPDELLSFLQSVPSDRLVNLHLPITVREATDPGTILYFQPVVEKTFHRGEHFLNKHPSEYLAAGEIHDVPLMIGHLPLDCAVMILNWEKQIQYWETYPELLIPKDVAMKCSPEKSIRLSDIIRKHYFKNAPVSHANKLEILTFANTFYFKYPLYRFIDMFLDHCKSTVYNYELNTFTNRNILSKLWPEINMKMACHGEDLMYLFNSDLLPMPVKGTIEHEQIVIITNFWCNFAKCGTPTPNSSNHKWLPYTKEERQTLNINSNPKMVEHHYQEIDLWNKIYSLFENELNNNKII